MELDYGAPRDPDETAAFGGILRRCFDTPADRVDPWVASIGEGNLRLLRRAGRVVAGLARIEMGQHFGGRAVPTTGVAAVGVPPEERGAGMARELMAALVRELGLEGQALSTLYPATYTLYRGAGYEQAGSRLSVEVGARAIGVRERGLAVRPIEDADAPAVEECYRRASLHRPGSLARGAYVWGRVRGPQATPAEGTLVERDGAVTGYLYLRRTKTDGHDYDLSLSDLVATDAESGRRLLGFLADHGSLARHVRWHEGPGGALRALLPERGARVSLPLPWMLRVVDPRAALAARGFAPELTGELHLELADPQLPEQAGRYVLQVAGGRAGLEPGGRGTLAIDARGLAALYSGFLSAEELAAAGRAAGPPEALRRASALFAGAAPGMSDMF